MSRSLKVHGYTYETEDNDGNDEGGHSTVGVLQHRWRCTSDQDHMAHKCSTDRDEDGVVSAKIGIGDPGSEQRCEVAPEGKECAETSCCTLPLAERTGVVTRFAARIRSGTRGCQEIPLDEVLEEDLSAVV
jgi:hypothetical protein